MLSNCEIILSQNRFFITLAGLPTATQYGGISLVTIEPAPTTAPSPIVTPERTMTLSAIQTLFPMTTGAFIDAKLGKPCLS